MKSFNAKLNCSRFASSTSILAGFQSSSPEWNKEISDMICLESPSMKGKSFEDVTEVDNSLPRGRSTVPHWNVGSLLDDKGAVWSRLDSVLKSCKNKGEQFSTVDVRVMSQLAFFLRTQHHLTMLDSGLPQGFYTFLRVANGTNEKYF